MELTLTGFRMGTCAGWVGRVDGFAERVATGRPLVADDRPVADHIRRCPGCREEFEVAVSVLADETI